MKVGWVFLLLVIGVIGVAIGVILHQSSTTFRPVKPGQTYRVGQKEHTVPSLKFRQTFYHLTDDTRQAMRDHLAQVVTFLEEHEIEYWMTSGTLLGSQRHEGLIPWDDDMDLCVSLEHQNTLRHHLKDHPTLTLREKPGLWKIRPRGKRFPFVDVLLMDTVVEDGTMWLRYCLPFDAQGKCTHGIHEEWPMEAMKAEWVFPVQKIPFEDLEVAAPQKPHEVIQYNYGKTALNEAHEKRWGRAHLPQFFNHRVAAYLGLDD